jgi:hypothetical protein
MKRIVVSLLVLFATISAFAQPLTRRAMDVNTVSDARLQAEKNFFLPRYADTTAANLSKGIDSCGALIFTYDNNTQWLRACNPKRWVKAAGSLVADNTATVNLSGDGSAATPLTADVNLSTTGQNAIVALADGLYVPNSVRNGLVWGGTVTWISGYTYNVSEAYYYINGSPFHSPTTTITLDPSDNDSSRIDLIVVNNQNLVAVVKGDLSTSPLEPTIDPSSQLRLSIVLVQAGTTEPTNNGTGLRRECIYQENTEWTTASSSARINPNSTNAPCVGSKDVEGTGVLNGDYVRFTRPSGNITILDSFQVITFQLKSKANWSNRKLILRWQSSGVNVGGVVNLSGTSYGWSSNLTGVCQTISIPLVDFGLPAGASVNQLLITASMPNGSIGFYLDQMCLQNQEQPSYATPITLQNGLNLDASTNIGELGGTLLHNTTNYTAGFVHTLSGASVYNYPYQFQQAQSFANGTGVASFLSAGALYNTSPDYLNRVRLGVNYTSDVYNTSPATEGYFGDRVGYMFNTNLRGHGSFGLYQDDSSSKNVGIFFHTKDNSYTDGVTIFAGAATNTTGDYSFTGLKTHKAAIFKTTGALQLPKYGVGTFTGTATYNLAVDASGNVIEVTGGGGGGGTDNLNAGSGYRILMPSTQQIKTLFNGYAIGIDSSSNTNGLTFKADTALLTTNAHLYKVVDSLPLGLQAITADNGLNANTSSNVRLGGTLIANTTIDATASYTLTFAGSSSNDVVHIDNTGTGGDALQVTQNSSHSAIFANNSGTGAGVAGTSTSGHGVLGTASASSSAGVSGANSAGGYGVAASSLSGFGLTVSTQTGATAGFFSANPATDNSVQTVLQIERKTSITAADGIGAGIKFQLESTAGVSRDAGSINYVYTTATDATRTSRFEIYGVNSTVTARKLAIAGNGKLTLDGYGSGTQTGTAVYGLSVDASGNVIERTLGLTAITADNGLTANTSSNVRLGGTLLQNTTIDGTASFGLTITGAQTGSNATTTINNTSSGHALIATASGSGYGVFASGFRGVYATTTTGRGVHAYASSSGTAAYIQATTGTAIASLQTPTQFNDVQNQIILDRFTSTNSNFGASGIGIGIQFGAVTTTSTASVAGGSITWKWSDATHASRTGKFDLNLSNNAGSLNSALGINGGGALQYTVNVVSGATNTITQNSSAIQVFSGSSGTTWTMPAVSGNTGLTFVIKNRGSASITLNSNAGGNDLYDTAAASTITITAGQSLRFTNDGTYYIVTSKY